MECQHRFIITQFYFKLTFTSYVLGWVFLTFIYHTLPGEWIFHINSMAILNINPFTLYHIILYTCMYTYSLYIYSVYLTEKKTNSILQVQIKKCYWVSRRKKNNINRLQQIFNIMSLQNGYKVYEYKTIDMAYMYT